MLTEERLSFNSRMFRIKYMLRCTSCVCTERRHTAAAGWHTSQPTGYSQKLSSESTGTGTSYGYRCGRPVALAQLRLQDYHLMLVPTMLREMIQDDSLRIGWFLHTPWPSSEVCLRLLILKPDPQPQPQP